MFYALEPAGNYKGRESFDLITKTGAFAGVIADAADGTVRAYFNFDGTRGSKRRFASRAAAIEYLHQRRERRAALRAAGIL